jgi:hypothetical protein
MFSCADTTDAVTTPWPAHAGRFSARVGIWNRKPPTVARRSKAAAAPEAVLAAPTLPALIREMLNVVLSSSAKEAPAVGRTDSGRTEESNRASVVLEERLICR